MEDYFNQPYFIKGLRNHVHDVAGFSTMRLVEVEPGHCVIEANAVESMANCYHNVHGGSLMTLVDMACTTAGFAHGKHVITLSSNFSFVRGVKPDGQVLRIEANVVHNGRTTMVVETVIYDEKGRACVRSSSTLFVPKELEPGDPIPDPPLAYDSWPAHPIADDPEGI